MLRRQVSSSHSIKISLHIVDQGTIPLGRREKYEEKQNEECSVSTTVASHVNAESTIFS